MSIIENVPGATPMGDISGLIPTHITTLAPLNEWEAANILKAYKKYLSRRKTWKINVAWLKEVHREMFSKTWKWAGKFRKTNFSIGVDKHEIPEHMAKLVGDIDYWKNNPDNIDLFEQSVIIHHRLVKIHPFKNGNGRHARLVSDIFLFSHDHKLPTWPNEKLINNTDIRNQYIKALKSADRGNYDLLKEFTRKLID